MVRFKLSLNELGLIYSRMIRLWNNEDCDHMLNEGDEQV